MSKKKRDRKKRRMRNESQRLRRKTRIDEHLHYGPFEIIRAGKFVIMKNNSTAEEQAERLEQIAEINRQFLSNLEVKIKELQGVISQYDPLKMMERAGYTALVLLTHGKTESEYDPDETKVLPGLEYLQYLIARTVPSENPVPLTDEDWESLWAKTLEVLDITASYLATRAPKGKNSPEVDGLVQFIDLMRLGVRVTRFPNFLEDYWRMSLEPYDDLLKKSYGLGWGKIVAGLKQIAEHQKIGIIEKWSMALGAVKKLRERAEELGLDESAPESYRAAIEANEELNHLNEEALEKLQEVLSVALFEITDVSSLPKEMLSLLSIRPGEEPLNQLTGPCYEDLSPLSTDIQHYKPFMEVDGRFYTFYHSGFEDRIAEIIETDLNVRYPNQRTAIEKTRSDYIEREAFKLLIDIVKPSYSALNLFYPNPDDEGPLTELDGLIEADDVLILVEVKSGGKSSGTNRGAPFSLEKDLKDLVFEGQRQSERAERYIKSADRVSFYNHTGKEVLHRLEHRRFRKVFRIVVTREDLGWAGANLAKLSVLDPSLSKSVPWHVSLDDLRAIADLFDGKSIVFTHYLEVRLQAAENLALSQSDEIEHVALYNAMNYYYKNVNPEADRMTFHAYAQPIDRYFMDKLSGDNPAKPEQKMPKEFRSFIDAMENTKLPHRFEIGAYLLGLDHNERQNVAKHLTKIFEDQGRNGHRVIRLISRGLSFGIGIGRIGDDKVEQEKLRCAVYMKNNSLDRWLLVNINTDSDLVVSDISELKANEFKDEDVDQARAQLERALSQNSTRLNIAPNQECPCGSGKRFKNCHGKKA